MKYALGLLLIGGIAWYLFSYTKKTKEKATNLNVNDQGQVVFAGPDIDPLTGNSTMPGVKMGTVGFSVQSIN